MEKYHGSVRGPFGVGAGEKSLGGEKHNDQFIEEYSYTDRVRFPGREGLYEGGISFAHDMGCYFTYSRRGQSAYERSNDSRNGFYFHMTTEELLNGIYCMAGYALKTGDAAWLKRAETCWKP